MRKLLLAAMFLSLASCGMREMVIDPPTAPVGPEAAAAPEGDVAVAGGSVQAAAGAFYEPLRSHGEWLWTAPTGWCWAPYNVPVNWRPYSDGRWLYTEDGWYWDSDYPWGWACFHYGRWYYDSVYGWVWVPGTVWAPSWVCWRYADDCVGWAPLPPACVWTAGLGFGEVDFGLIIPAWHFCFVDFDHFRDHDLHGRIFHRARNVTFFNRTKVDMHFREVDGRLVNDPPTVRERIAKSAGGPLERMKVAPVDSPRAMAVEKNEVRVFQPQMPRPGGASEPAAPQTPRMTAHALPWLREVPPAPPAEVQQRHLEERRTLQEEQAAQQRLLEEQHRGELAKPPPSMPQERVRQQHEAELRAMQEEHQRQQQQIENWQRREQWMRAAPAPERRYTVPRQPERGTQPEGGGRRR